MGGAKSPPRDEPRTHAGVVLRELAAMRTAKRDLLLNRCWKRKRSCSARRALVAEAISLVMEGKAPGLLPSINNSAPASLPAHRRARWTWWARPWREVPPGGRRRAMPKPRHAMVQNYVQPRPHDLRAAASAGERHRQAAFRSCRACPSSHAAGGRRRPDSLRIGEETDREKPADGCAEQAAHIARRWMVTTASAGWRQPFPRRRAVPAAASRSRRPAAAPARRPAAARGRVAASRRGARGHGFWAHSRKAARSPA